MMHEFGHALDLADLKDMRRIYDVGTPLDKPSDLDVFVNYAEGKVEIIWSPVFEAEEFETRTYWSDYSMKWFQIDRTSPPKVKNLTTTFDPQITSRGVRIKNHRKNDKLCKT